MDSKYAAKSREHLFYIRFSSALLSDLAPHVHIPINRRVASILEKTQVFPSFYNVSNIICGLLFLPTSVPPTMMFHLDDSANIITENLLWAGHNPLPELGMYREGRVLPSR